MFVGFSSNSHDIVKYKIKIFTRRDCIIWKHMSKTLLISVIHDCFMGTRHVRVKLFTMLGRGKEESAKLQAWICAL